MLRIDLRVHDLISLVPYHISLYLVVLYQYMRCLSEDCLLYILDFVSLFLFFFLYIFQLDVVTIL